MGLFAHLILLALALYGWPRIRKIYDCHVGVLHQCKITRSHGDLTQVGASESGFHVFYHNAGLIWGCYVDLHAFDWEYLHGWNLVRHVSEELVTSFVPLHTVEAVSSEVVAAGEVSRFAFLEVLGDANRKIRQTINHLKKRCQDQVNFMVYGPHFGALFGHSRQKTMKPTWSNQKDCVFALGKTRIRWCNGIRHKKKRSLRVVFSSKFSLVSELLCLLIEKNRLELSRSI